MKSAKGKIKKLAEKLFKKSKRGMVYENWGPVHQKYLDERKRKGEETRAQSLLVIEKFSKLPTQEFLPDTPISIFGPKGEKVSLLDIIPDDVTFSDETVNEFSKLMNLLESRKDLDHIWMKLSDYMHRVGVVSHEFFTFCSSVDHKPTPSSFGWARLQENCYNISPELATKTARTLRRIAEHGYYSEAFEEK